MEKSSTIRGGAAAEVKHEGVEQNNRILDSCWQPTGGECTVGGTCDNCCHGQLCVEPGIVQCRNKFNVLAPGVLQDGTLCDPPDPEYYEYE